MKHRAISILLVIVAGIFLLSGCAVTGGPVPETAREKYAAAEASYNAAVVTVEQLATAGQFQQGTPDALAVAASLRTARSALNVWGIALDNLSRQQAALAALGGLQQLLVDLQRRDQ